MSEAQSHSSAGSQGSIRPDDCVSQILPPYFTDNSGYRYDLDNVIYLLPAHHRNAAHHGNHWKIKSIF